MIINRIFPYFFQEDVQEDSISTTIVDWTRSAIGSVSSCPSYLSQKCYQLLTRCISSFGEPKPLDTWEFLVYEWPPEGYNFCILEKRNDQNKEVGCQFFDNRSFYSGQFKEDQPDGYGRAVFASQEIYEGEWKNGNPHGVGCWIFPRNSAYAKYEGQFVEGKFSGYGVLTFAEGTRYEGEFKEGLFEGHGCHTASIGGILKGQFSKGIASFKGLYINNAGVEFEGEFLNFKITDMDRSRIGDLHFFRLLYDLSGGAPPGYAIGILADYLMHYFKDDPALEQIISSLKDAVDRYVEDTDTQVTKIFEQLEAGKECLLCFECKGHGMLLNLTPTQDGQSIECEIFNSGQGLSNYHEWDFWQNKFQTMKKVTIPREQLIKEKLVEWIENSNFTIDEAYNSILTIPGAQYDRHTILHSLWRMVGGKTLSDYLWGKDPKAPTVVWQPPQIAGSCDLHRAIALLRHKLPLPVYKKVRRALYRDSLEATIARNPKKIRELLDEPRVRHKRRKLHF